MSAGVGGVPSAATVSHCTFLDNRAQGGAAGGFPFTRSGIGGAILSGDGSMASKVTKATEIASPMPPLNAVRNAPSMKNWVRILRYVAPSALRKPISLVRSVTETSMMLMIPIAPSPSVTSPTTPRNQSIASKILPTRCEFSIVSQSSNASSSLGSKPCRRPMILCTSCLARRCWSRVMGR